ncbi:uncharacterized protein N7483_009158 [Penicillium malachiteum]|uniref:uncharacterized protein n=1 Tax=Penicillium malachiteum TaxID=1324776 RepID=UPI002548D53D|nr:uncharacterized protein N7483_009158 [Penicillium malachiteum]KAJ5721224.1 hypothetical protein N7483_009158 [Penicillium malachiteum]
MKLHHVLLLGLATFVKLITAEYRLQDDYGNDDSFFDKFDFFTEPDPTRGFVQYVNKWDARNTGLISASGGSIYLSVDSRNVADNAGRHSVRLTSYKEYNHALVILDLAHMPGSICGTWPAFWMVGTVPPTAGEIDIIEGVNEGPNNEITLHTDHDGCSVDEGGFSGNIDRRNCYIYSTGPGGSGGCGIVDPDAASYGDAFNGRGGGVFATEWTGNAIKVWRFSNSSVPWDIVTGNPNPAGWGTPVASFSGPCNIDSQFQNLHIVFDVTFCGSWAGSSWSSSRVCAPKAATCVEYVQNNPGAFAESYWRVRSLKVYQNI